MIFDLCSKWPSLEVFITTLHGYVKQWMIVNEWIIDFFIRNVMISGVRVC